jgi:ribosomal protein S17E
MGKIKQKLIRRTASSLIKRGVQFSEDFGENKEILGNSLPSKKIRNQLSGLLSKIKKKERIEMEKLKKETAKEI